MGATRSWPANRQPEDDEVNRFPGRVTAGCRGVQLPGAKADGEELVVAVVSLRVAAERSPAPGAEITLPVSSRTSTS